MHKAIQAVVDAAQKKGVTVTAKTKTKVKASPSKSMKG